MSKDKKHLLGNIHPFTCMVFFLCVVFIVFVTLDPVVICVSLLCGFCYGITLRLKSLIKYMALFLPLSILFVIVNPLFNKAGEVLFYIGDIVITNQGVYYGIMSALRLLSVLVWFFSYNIVLQSNKYVYMFGKFMPNIALILSTTMGMMPRIMHEYKEINLAQKLIGKTNHGLINKIKYGLNAVGILICSSLESGIVTANVIDSKGYSNKKRTSYHMYKFGFIDCILILCSVLCLALTVFCTISFGFGVYEFLQSLAISYNNYQAVLLVVFSIVCAMPSITQILWRLKWNYIKSKI